MIEDMELAQRLGYSRPRTIKDLIKRMIEGGDLTPDDYRRTVRRLTNGEAEAFYLTETAAVLVATRSDTEKAKQITRQVIEVFIEYRKGRMPAIQSEAPKSLAAPIIESKNMLGAFLEVSKMLGTDTPMARAVSVDRVIEHGGVDFRPFLIGNTVEDPPVIPTELGAMVKLSAERINKSLEQAGLQTRQGKGWELTAAGREYASMEPYKSRSSEHSGYRIKWHPKVLGLLGYAVTEKITV
jgi:hypothetical protein